MDCTIEIDVAKTTPLMQRLNVTTYAELIDFALGFLAFTIDETEKGNHICSIDYSTKSVTIAKL